MFKLTFFVVSMMISNVANSWTPNNEKSKVVQIVQWQGTQSTVILLGSGVRCYIPATETNLISLVLSLYISKSDAYWHCADLEENIGGYLSHRLHRVVTG
jgi:hypothetical protein